MHLRTAFFAVGLALLLSATGFAHHPHGGYWGPRGVYFGYYAPPPVYVAPPPPVYVAPAPMMMVPPPPAYYYPPPYRGGFGYPGPGFSFYYGR